MSNLRKAAQQALEFLDAEFGWSPGEAPRIDALRAALEQPEQEPVNYFEVQRIANERGLDYNKFAAALRDYAALKERNA